MGYTDPTMISSDQEVLDELNKILGYEVKLVVFLRPYGVAYNIKNKRIWGLKILGTWLYDFPMGLLRDKDGS